MIVTYFLLCSKLKQRKCHHRVALSKQNLSEQRQGCRIYITKGDGVLASWIYLTGKHKRPLYLFLFLFCASLSSTLPSTKNIPEVLSMNKAKKKKSHFVTADVLECWGLLPCCHELFLTLFDICWIEIDPVCAVMIMVLPGWTLLVPISETHSGLSVFYPDL